MCKVLVIQVLGHGQEDSRSLLAISSQWVGSSFSEREAGSKKIRWRAIEEDISCTHIHSPTTSTPTEREGGGEGKGGERDMDRERKKAVR